MANDWHPDYLDAMLRRIRRLQVLKSNPAQQAAWKIFYKAHPAIFIEDWGVTYDPRNKHPVPRVMPFLLFQRQKEFVDFIYGCINDGENGLVEKSRDMGASWTCCAISVHLWLFHDGTAIGWGSRKEDLVDKKGDMSAIFPKMRMIIDNLPAWLIPQGYKPAIHAAHMKIINPENGSVITGEAGDNIGRGGRTTVYFKDEAAHYERPELIEAALGDNTDVQIDISSVNGTNNVFYRRRMAGEVWTSGCVIPRGKTRVFIFDWRDHPGKSQEWYDRRRAKAESEALLHVFNQEVDRDYAGAIQGVIIPATWVNAIVDAHIRLKELWPDKYPRGIPVEGEKVAMQDVADGGGDKNALLARHGVVCNYADHWAGEAGEAAKIAVPTCLTLGVKELYYDSIGVGVGFKVQINTMKSWPNYPRHLRIYPWNAGADPLDPDDPVIPGDDQSPLNKDQYLNLKAQAWFRVRTRCYKTYRAVVYGDVFPVEELISIDSRIARLHELKLELSQAVKKTNTNNGKTMVDKQPDGAISPNLADAFIGMYNPVRELSILDVL